MPGLDRKFFARETEAVARDLIGCSLRRRWGEDWIGGWIVETEAYLDGTVDPASHSVAGPTARNAAMFGPPGNLYVYTIHTRHCVNVATEAIGIGAAVLIRAIQPVWGVPVMADRRNLLFQGPWPDQPLQIQRRLTSGPGMLCQSLEIDLRHNDRDAIGDADVHLGPPPTRQPIKIRRSPRIGISAAADRPLRFFADGNRYVSGRASDHGVARRLTLPIEA